MFTTIDRTWQQDCSYHASKHKMQVHASTATDIVFILVALACTSSAWPTTSFLIAICIWHRCFRRPTTRLPTRIELFQLCKTPAKPGLDDICAFCREHYVDRNPVELPCRHVYCTECIERWLDKDCLCPLCRRQLYCIPLTWALWFMDRAKLGIALGLLTSTTGWLGLISKGELKLSWCVTSKFALDLACGMILLLVLHGLEKPFADNWTLIWDDVYRTSLPWALFPLWNATMFSLCVLFVAVVYAVRTDFWLQKAVACP